MYTKAIVRKPCKKFAYGLTTSNLAKPKYDLMLRQHSAYVDTLRYLGLLVIELEALTDYPDAHFVEDTAIVVPEIAIITRPGAESRRGEEVSIAKELKKYRAIKLIIEPGTLDGGDVLVIDKQVFIGLSERTNQEGANQLSNILFDFGYKSESINVEEGLHLKSDVNYIGRNTLLVTKKYYDNAEFKKFEKICVESDENYVANSLLINDKVLVPKGFLKTNEKLKQTGFKLIELEMSESQKMDGGLTCLSLRF